MKRIKSNRFASQSGTTLIELSVVIAVLILLATVLFMGVTAWKNGANRAASVVAISSIQKAVRGAENMLGYPEGNTFTYHIGVAPGVAGADLVGDKFFSDAVKDPVTGQPFGDFGHVPPIGTLFATPAASVGTQTSLGTIDISNW